MSAADPRFVVVRVDNKRSGKNYVIAERVPEEQLPPSAPPQEEVPRDE